MLCRRISEINSPSASQEIIRLVWNMEANNNASDERSFLHYIPVFLRFIL
jgi:hypothetical protein